VATKLHFEIRFLHLIKLSASLCDNRQVKKYFITFAAIAILGMIGIYYGPTALKSNDTQSTPSANTSNTNPSTQPSNPSISTSSSNPSTQPSNPSTMQGPSYKDGTFTGKDYQNPYGDVQISIIINSGKITSVNLISMPSTERRSQYLTSMAGPILKSQTIAAQNAQIDGVSGATYTSQSYQQSLQSALDQAKTA
jgi:uncharacterized protein with FMN-binding domain